LVLTRALPILAEASVLALGALGLSWRRFFPAVALSNLGIAAIYSVFGALAREREAVIPAMAASVVVPLAAAALVRWRWTRPLAKD
jgi:3-dehydroquinate synthase